MSSEFSNRLAARDVPDKNLSISAAGNETAVVFCNTRVAHFVSMAGVRFDQQTAVGIPQTRRSILQAKLETAQV